MPVERHFLIQFINTDFVLIKIFFRNLLNSGTFDLVTLIKINTDISTLPKFLSQIGHMEILLFDFINFDEIIIRNINSVENR